MLSTGAAVLALINGQSAILAALEFTAAACGVVVLVEEIRRFKLTRR